MKQWETWLSHLSTILVTASGIAYFWMKYVLVNDDPFSVLNHPWQPFMLNLHLLTAPFLVFVVGLITYTHIWKKLNSPNRSNRRSGLVSAITLPLMILSGYGLQILSNPLLIQIVLVLHLATSSLFALSYLAHQIVSLLALKGSMPDRGTGALARS